MPQPFNIKKSSNEEVWFHLWSAFYPFFVSFLDEDVATSAEETSTTSTKVRKDLSEWQERHAILVLSKVKVHTHLVLILRFPFSIFACNFELPHDILVMFMNRNSWLTDFPIYYNVVKIYFLWIWPMESPLFCKFCDVILVPKFLTTLLTGYKF